MHVTISQKKMKGGERTLMQISVLIRSLKLRLLLLSQLVNWALLHEISFTSTYIIHCEVEDVLERVTSPWDSKDRQYL